MYMNTTSLLLWGVYLLIHVLYVCAILILNACYDSVDQLPIFKMFVYNNYIHVYTIDNKM